MFLDEGLQHFQVIGFRPGRVVIKRLANVQTLLQHGKRCFELANSCGGRCQLCLFLRPLVIKNGKLCLQFRGLIGKEFPLDRDQGRRRSLGRREICQWIAVRKRRAQPRDIELSGNQIALQVTCLRFVHCRIELDQNFSLLYGLSIVDMDRAHDPSLKRLDDLRVAGGDDFARG